MADESNVTDELAPKRKLENSGPAQEDDKKEENKEELVSGDGGGDDDFKFKDIGDDDFVNDTPPIFTSTHCIKFKWNPDVKELEDCDTKHLLLCLWHALQKTRDRTIERNKGFRSLNRADRIQKYQDNPRIMTHFIEWHNKDPENNKFDGELLKEKGKKNFTNEVLTDIGGTKMGWSTKIYHYLTKEVDISDVKTGETWPLQLPNYGYSKLVSDGKVLAECTKEEIKKILEQIVMPRCRDSSKKAWPLDGHQQKILKFIDDNNLNGEEFVALGKKNFMKQLGAVLDPNNKRINGPINKMYGSVCKVDLNKEELK